MTYGITPEGFNRKTEDIIKKEIQDDLRGTISPKIDLDRPRSKLANVLRPGAIKPLGELWELAEYCANSIDPANNTGLATVQLAAQQSITNLGYRAGSVIVQVELEEGTYAAGSIPLVVSDDPANTWTNRYAITAATEDTYEVLFVSDLLGSAAAAPAESLVLATATDGVLSVYQPEDATRGADEETPEELEARRKASLALRGSGTAAAIRAAVLAVNGVEQCVIFSNRKSEPEDGVPAHSHRVVIYDGAGVANDDAVAQAIYSEQTNGVRSFGEIGGNITDANGQAGVEYFDRATTRELTADVEVLSSSGIDQAGLKAAISKAVTGQIGGKLYLRRLESLVVSWPGVDDLAVDIEVDGDTENITAEADERLYLPVANITVVVS